LSRSDLCADAVIEAIDIHSCGTYLATVCKRYL
jgi:hypothetical protein